jgi:hypothetical protein
VASRATKCGNRKLRWCCGSSMTRSLLKLPHHPVCASLTSWGLGRRRRRWVRPTFSEGCRGSNGRSQNGCAASRATKCRNRKLRRCCGSSMTHSLLKLLRHAVCASLTGCMSRTGVPSKAMDMQGFLAKGGSVQLPRQQKAKGGSDPNECAASLATERGGQKLRWCGGSSTTHSRASLPPRALRMLLFAVQLAYSLQQGDVILLCGCPRSCPLILGGSSGF